MPHRVHSEEMMNIEEIALDEIIPYENNPRNNAPVSPIKIFAGFRL